MIREQTILRVGRVTIIEVESRTYRVTVDGKSVDSTDDLGAALRVVKKESEKNG